MLIPAHMPQGHDRSNLAEDATIPAIVGVAEECSRGYCTKPNRSSSHYTDVEAVSDCDVRVLPCEHDVQERVC